MSSKWHEKKNKIAEYEFEKALLLSADDTTVQDVAKDSALGKGEEKIFEKKLSKEEKKARAKAAREAKKKKKGKGGGDGDDDDDDEDDNKEDTPNASEVLTAAKEAIATDAGMSIEDDGIDHEKADALAANGTICTFAASRKGVDARARDINVSNFTLQHKGAVMLDETEIILNHGNRYVIALEVLCSVCGVSFCDFWCDGGYLLLDFNFGGRKNVRHHIIVFVVVFSHSRS